MKLRAYNNFKHLVFIIVPITDVAYLFLLWYCIVEIMDDRRKAQEQRERESRQRQIKKDEIPVKAPLFGPPLKVI